MLDPSGRFLRAFGSQGTADGKFNYPWGVTTDALGFIYVCDKENHRVQVCANILTYLNNNDYNWLNRCRFSNPMALLWVNSAHAAKKKASWNTHTTSPCRTPIALSSPIQTTIVFRYLMWMDACCPHSVLKAPKRDNSSSPGKYPTCSVNITRSYNFLLLLRSTEALRLMTKATFVWPIRATIAYKSSILMEASCVLSAHGVPVMPNSRDLKVLLLCPMATFWFAIVKIIASRSSKQTYYDFSFVCFTLSKMVRIAANNSISRKIHFSFFSFHS